MKPEHMPTKKVSWGAAVNAAIGIGAWALRDFGGILIPGEVQGMFHTIAVFAVQWFVTDSVRPS